MNRAEAKTVLTDHFGHYRGWSHAELVQLVNHHDTFVTIAASGASYYFELQVQWDDRPGGSLRISGSVHDDDLRAFDLLRETFVIPPESGTR